MILASTSFQPNQVPTASTSPIIGNAERLNETLRQRRPQEPTGPIQPPGTEGPNVPHSVRVISDCISNMPIRLAIAYQMKSDFRCCVFSPNFDLLVSGYEYRIPPIWKRFAAEFIDSTMLFLLKFSISFIAIDVFDFMYVKCIISLE